METRTVSEERFDALCRAVQYTLAAIEYTRNSEAGNAEEALTAAQRALDIACDRLLGLQ